MIKLQKIDFDANYTGWLKKKFYQKKKYISIADEWVFYEVVNFI